MASQDTLTRVQELYVAYYGRPADKGGLQYWADRVEADGGIDAIINAFGDSAEYTELAEGQGAGTLVNNIYQQAFGRDADDGGLAYYIGVLESGEKSLAEIATTIINAAGPGDKEVFEARAAAAAEYTESLDSDDDYDLAAAKEAVATAEPEADPAGLTEMLGELQDAQSEVSTFIEESASNEYVEEQLAVDPEDANETQVRTAITAADDAAELALKNDGGLGQGDSLNVLKAKVLDAEEALTEAESAVAEEDGLTSAQASLASAEAGYEAAIKASDAADTALNAEIAKVEELNGGTASLDLSVNGAFDGDADKTLIQDASNNPIIVLGDGNQLVAEDGVNTEANPIEGFDALLAAAQEAYDKSLAEESAKDTFEAELEDVLDIESPEWKESDVAVNIAADANKVEAVEADTVLFDDATGNYIATADGTDYYDATSNGDGTFTIDSTATTSATVGDFDAVTDVQVSVGGFTDTGASDTTVDTLAESDSTPGTYVAYASGSPGTAYTANVAADGSVSYDSTETPTIDASTGYTEVAYVDGAAITDVTDTNTAIGDGVVDNSAAELYALADDSGYVVSVGGNYYAADVSDPTNVTWDSSTAPVTSGVDTSAAINSITVEGDASALISGYYTDNTDSDGDGSFDVEFTGAFDTAAPLVADVLSKQATLQAAQEEVTDREELVDDYNQTQALVDELAKLDKAVDDAEKALDDEGFVVESIDSASEAGTADSDVFLLGDTDSIISGFELTTEEEAGDSIFIGEQLSIVVAGEDQDISDDLGDVSAQELIVVDDGANTTLYFEEKSFAGNGSTEGDMTVVELTGVTGGEVSINSDGFLTVA